MACDEWILVPMKAGPKQQIIKYTPSVKTDQDIPLRLIYLYQLRRAFEQIKTKDPNLGTGIL